MKKKSDQNSVFLMDTSATQMTFENSLDSKICFFLPYFLKNLAKFIHVCGFKG